MGWLGEVARWVAEFDRWVWKKGYVRKRGRGSEKGGGEINDVKCSRSE